MHDKTQTEHKIFSYYGAPANNVFNLQPQQLPNLLKQNKSDNHSFDYFAGQQQNAAGFQPIHKMDACVFGNTSPKAASKGVSEEPVFNPFKTSAQKPSPTNSTS